MSAFREPPTDERKKRCRDLLLVPPILHVTAFVTGGLKETYNKIRCKRPRTAYQTGLYTDQHGYFDPQPEMPLLASRYQFVRVIGKGQSAVIIKAKDSFQDNQLVSIKVLHTTNFLIGSQEADIMLEMNGVDPFGYVPVVRLLNIFSFDDHYCLTFDLLHPDPITDHFKAMGYIKEELLSPIREVTIKLLSVLGFLNRINIIHADLKPDNILVKEENLSASLRVVDFGNAIRCVHEELSLYYCDYELQTLIYRAPEVLLGLSFGLQVDVWSLGCIIAELYLGQPLFLGRNKNEVLTKITSILGPLPEEFTKGEYSSQFNQFIGNPWNKFEIMQRLSDVLGRCWDWKFVDFLAGLLALSPGDRSTPSLAICHPFLASSLSFLYLLAPNTYEKPFYSSTVTQNTYKKKPIVQENAPNLFKSHVRRTLEETPPLTTPESTEDDLNSPEEEKETCFTQKKQLQISNTSVLNAFSKQNDKLRFQRKRKNLIQGKRKKKARRKRVGAVKSPQSAASDAAQCELSLMTDESVVEIQSAKQSSQTSLPNEALNDPIVSTSSYNHSSVAKSKNLIK